MEAFRQQNSEPRRNLRAEIERLTLKREDFSKLEMRERERLVAETAEDMIELFKEHNAEEFKDVGKMYSSLPGEKIFVRRDSPERVLDLVANGKPLEISFPEGERYSNAVEWSQGLANRGLENAYLEGYGQLNSLVTVVGFKKNPDIDVQTLPDASQQFAGLDRSFVRSIKGTVAPEDLLFVSLRIPSFAYPKEKMTDAELERHEAYEEKRTDKGPSSPTFIHRGFLFKDNIQKE